MGVIVVRLELWVAVLLAMERSVSVAVSLAEQGL
jgi:hypothetical protein